MSGTETAEDGKLRIGFMGTPDFALAALEALHESGHRIVCVYSQPPRPKGRGHKLQKSPVHTYAETHSIPVFTPLTLKDKKAQDEFAAHDLDVAIVAAYGLLLPEVVLDTPRYGCVNIHASLLPRWRGASPIQQAIWRGDTETGITLMQMDKGLDTGPIISMEKITITPETTSTSLHDEMCALGRNMILRFCHDLAKYGAYETVQQNNDETTYAPLLSKEHGRVDWSQSAQQIDSQIRALNPWPGVWAAYGEDKVKILRAKPCALPDSHGAEKTGQILDKHGLVRCGEGSCLQILEIQSAGKKAMDFASAVNGGYFEVGGQFL